MKTITNFKILAVLFTCLFFTSAKSQCVSNFSYVQNANGNVTFTNLSISGPSTGYYWLFGDNQNSTLTNPSHNYAANGTYFVTLFLYDTLAACSGTFNAQITVTNVPCNVNPAFTFNVNSNNNVTFVNTSTGTIPQTMYYLQYGDNTSSNFPNNSFTSTSHTYPNAGNYTATLTAFNSSVSCFASYTANISIPPCPIVTSFNLVKDTTVMPSIVWNAYPTYPANVTGVTWSWGDNTSSSSLYPSHNYAAAGIYNICLTVSVSCGSATTTCLNQNIFKTGSNMQMASINVINALITNIKNNEPAAAIRLYPNPVKDLLSIESDAAEINVIITDLYGKIVYSGMRTGDSKINVENLKAGIYFVKIANTEFSKTSKIIKE